LAMNRNRADHDEFESLGKRAKKYEALRERVIGVQSTDINTIAAQYGVRFDSANGRAFDLSKGNKIAAGRFFSVRFEK
jgi:hypothetical protein